MKELKVINIRENSYLLIDTNTKESFQHLLNFFECDVEVGDIIVMHDELLNKKYLEYDEEYYFGPIDEIYGREIKGLKDTDLITIKKDNKKIYLKRFYG